MKWVLYIKGALGSIYSKVKSDGILYFMDCGPYAVHRPHVNNSYTQHSLPNACSVSL